MSNTTAQKKETPMTDADFFHTSLAQADPEVFAAIGQELKRQQDQIELIASENIVSKAVLQAQGSVRPLGVVVAGAGLADVQDVLSTVHCREKRPPR